MKSILMIGLGRFGRHMAQKFIEEGNDVLAIEYSEERADKATDILRDIQIGDATDEKFMETLGVNNFDICVVAIGNNFQTALEITVILKDLGAKFIIARATREIYEKLLLRNGADHVVYAERDMAERLAIKYGAKNIFDYIELTPEVAIYEIAVPSSWHGKSILEQNIRARYNVSILAVKQNGTINPMPSPDYRFSGRETIMVMGSNNDIRAITKK
ncbi:MAG: potassium channel family protein [Acutalibacteraceae bacterium]